ncbi:MAG: ACP S-malonyltransferase [Acidaminobacter sp.]|uniref:ACP S-malonyltransferase n=1 Tax=Acidaminobacter sp. TaxID=1872102 RepID=UPI00137D4899|nr:ACP S-malonyltransferase [Acidaminobacter sp.]MZQ96482.1 ACP S-malonyltransferase [Acidaminobacter sp.]
MSKIGIVFPGQGAQYVGMGKEFAAQFDSAKAIFDLAGKSLDMDMSALCFDSSEEALQKTENTQPSILTVSYAIYTAVKEVLGLEPDAFAGLSLGEYTALVAADAMAFEDAVRIVRKRGQFMQEEVPLGIGGMAALLGVEREDVLKVCEEASVFGICEPANFNCPKQVVVAGELEAVKKAIEISKNYGAKKAVLLPVSAPFHTSMLLGAGEKLRQEMQKYDFKAPSHPVYSNVTGDRLDAGTDVRENLVKQVFNSVLWEDCVAAMVRDGITTFIEVGPGNALTKFIRKIDKDVDVYNVEKPEDLEALREKLKEAAHV